MFERTVLLVGNKKKKTLDVEVQTWKILLTKFLKDIGLIMFAKECFNSKYGWGYKIDVDNIFAVVEHI